MNSRQCVSSGLCWIILAPPSLQFSGLIYLLTEVLKRCHRNTFSFATLYIAHFNSKVIHRASHEIEKASKQNVKAAQLATDTKELLSFKSLRIEGLVLFQRVLPSFPVGLVKHQH